MQKRERGQEKRGQTKCQEENDTKPKVAEEGKRAGKEDQGRAEGGDVGLRTGASSSPVVLRARPRSALRQLTRILFSLACLVKLARSWP
ncbi:hypothetical protein B0H67DRAFT_283254 [Lasiosphaeris hirsuta]|uniref:Uncharacterized protein n=1 Tax=Lasiosphaeris hirsuta TaxID=260670 RepID=A0AA40A8L0_9PEZI|nr:hypothetical protein B0H67DRAFT_283254 [Lasiosphaeris hirsuta]